MCEKLSSYGNMPYWSILILSSTQVLKCLREKNCNPPSRWNTKYMFMYNTWVIRGALQAYKAIICTSMMYVDVESIANSATCNMSQNEAPPPQCGGFHFYPPCLYGSSRSVSSSRGICIATNRFKRRPSCVMWGESRCRMYDFPDIVFPRSVY